MKFSITDPHEEIYLYLRQELYRIYIQDGTLLKELDTPRGARERIKNYITSREDTEIFKYFIGTRWQNLQLDRGDIPKDFKLLDLEDSEEEEEVLDYNNEEEQKIIPKY